MSESAEFYGMEQENFFFLAELDVRIWLVCNIVCLSCLPAKKRRFYPPFI